MSRCQHELIADQASGALVLDVAVKVGITDGGHVRKLASFRTLTSDNQLSADVAFGDVNFLHCPGIRSKRELTERDFLVDVLRVLDALWKGQKDLKTARTVNGIRKISLLWLIRSLKRFSSGDAVV